jgi:hypothetical protein
MIEYMGIKIDNPKALMKNGELNPQVKNSLDRLIKNLSESNYKLISPYENSKTKMELLCDQGHTLEMNFSNFGQGKRCNQCRSEISEKKLYKTLEERGHELLSPFVKGSEKVLINFKCGHDPHWITPNNYNIGKGCRECRHDKIMKVNNEKSEDTMGNFFELLKTNDHVVIDGIYGYRNHLTIDFKCGHEPSKHTPADYLQGLKCPECAIKKRGMTRRNNSEKELLKRAKKRGHKILSKYEVSKDKILVDFNCHHEPSWVLANNYQTKECGCNKCGEEKTALIHLKKGEVSFHEFLKKNNIKALTEYKGINERVNMKFNDCGHTNWILPVSLKHGKCGCLICNKSLGVQAVCKWLKENEIMYDLEYKLIKRNWRYDIYIPYHNLLIEVHGKQHYEEVPFFDYRTLEEEQENDRKKRRYAESLGYNYIEVDYREGKPELALERFLDQFKLYKHNRRNKNQYRRTYEQLSLF